MILSRRSLCQKLISKFTIYSNGDVPYCNEDFMGKYPVGNITEKSIEEIWHKGAIPELRDNHLSGNFETFELCPKCLDWDKV